MNLHELISLLERHNIPLSEWGTGVTKTTAHLLEEIDSGEATLTEIAGQLHWKGRVVALNVYYKEVGKMFKLREAKQVFTDGRERVRSSSTSISEKLKHGENPISGASRLLSEELGIKEELVFIPQPQIIVAAELSPAYPGIFSSYTVDVFNVFLTPSTYREEGYIETQPDKTNYFMWDLVVER